METKFFQVLSICPLQKNQIKVALKAFNSQKANEILRNWNWKRPFLKKVSYYILNLMFFFVS